MLIKDLEIGNPHHELGSIVALIRSATIPVDQIGTVVDHVGSAVRVVKASDDDEFRLLGLPPLIGAVTDDSVSIGIREAGEWLDEGHDIRTVLDSGYPVNLHGIFNKPPLLFVRGTWREEADSASVAVVGSRKASEAGRRRAGQLARDLGEAGYTVLSGLAQGIDAAAHVGCLQYGGRTCAVMGTGIDRIYPKGNETIAEGILESGGALLSQFFPEQPPTQWTFPKRNVVMSGLSVATVVIEAGETSGAKMQARVALQHGRTVFLLTSLVESHDWARKYSEKGIYGTRALVLKDTSDVIDRLELRGPKPDLVTS